MDRHSPFTDHRKEDRFGQRGQTMPQPMAAEITVHNRRGRQKSSADSADRDTHGNLQAAKDRTSKSPQRPQYDTRAEDGTTLNNNQKKPYNAKFEFFTKPLGPGHYQPNLESTKPKAKVNAWGSSKVRREGAIGPSKAHV